MVGDRYTISPLIALVIPHSKASNVLFAASRNRIPRRKLNFSVVLQAFWNVFFTVFQLKWYAKVHFLLSLYKSKVSHRIGLNGNFLSVAGIGVIPSTLIPPSVRSAVSVLHESTQHPRPGLVTSGKRSSSSAAANLIKNCLITATGSPAGSRLVAGSAVVSRYDETCCWSRINCKVTSKWGRAQVIK